MKTYTFDVPTMVTVYVSGDLTAEEAEDAIAEALGMGVTLDVTAVPGLVLHQVGPLDGHPMELIDED